MNESMLDIFSEIKSEKKIDNPTITKIMVDILKKEIVKKFGTSDNFVFILNPANGDFEIWQNKTVVDDSEFIDENKHIKLSEAKKIEDDFEIGEEFSEEFEIKKLGRRSILNVKNSLKNNITEFNNNKIIERFEDMIGYLYTAEIVHVKRNAVILMDNDDNEILLEKKDQIKGEFYKKGFKLTGIIKSADVIKGKPVIKINRNSPEFLEAILEDEISEIYDGLITIKKIVREAGIKSKVILESNDYRIDPVGTCVGRNGQRILSIKREISGEDIDIINYTENLYLLVSRCLKPANVKKVDLNDDKLNVYLDSSEIGKAIGKKGINVRLTSELLGYEINILSDSKNEDVDYDIALEEFDDEIDKWILDEFIKVGLSTAKSVLKHNIKTLEDITDLEEETIDYVINILKSEFEE